MEVRSGSTFMECTKNETKFGFIGVFLLGILGIWMTANYYLNKEAGEDREARGRRVSAEVTRFKETEKSAFEAIRKPAANLTHSGKR